MSSKWTHIESVTKIIDKVGGLINQLNDDRLHGSELVSIETKLAAYYAFLSSKTAENQAEMNSKYWIRKIAYGKNYALLRNKVTQGDAANGANDLIQTEIDAELLANYRFEHLKMFCKGIELNLISIAHRLKHLQAQAAQNKLPN